MEKKNLKIRLSLALICLLDSAALWATPKLFNNYSHYFSYEKKTFTTGLKIDLSMAEGRFAIDTKGNYNFGLSVFSGNYLKKFPIECQAGNLSIGGIVSKLNDPMIDTSTSGFGGCYSSPSIITSSLPSYTTFSKPFASFLEAGWENEKTVVQKAVVNCAYWPKTKELSLSTKIKIGIGENVGITNTFGFSIFTLEENNSKSWYFTIPYYRKSGSFCFANQLELELFNFLTNFSIFTYKSPFPENKKNNGACNIFENIYKAENKIIIDKFTISISALFNHNKNTISRENKVLNPCTQIKTNVQYNYDFGEDNDYNVKAGFTAFGNISGLKNKEDDFKLGVSTSITFPLASVLAEGNCSYKFFEDSSMMILKFVSANIENTWKIDFFSPSIGISSQYYISQKNSNISKNYKINIGFSFWDETITNDNSFSFSIKNDQICNKKLKTGLNINFSYKKLLISAKIAGEFSLQ